MYDVLIIGLGAAGYTAAIYAARYKLSVFIVGAEEGGMGMTAVEVGNWPGDIDVKGPDLMERFRQHALSFGDAVSHRLSHVKSVERAPDGTFVLHLDGGDTVQGRSVIFAMGSYKRHLGVPGEEEFSGKGVTYCATCDAFFYRGKDVAVIGGGDSAVEGAAITAQVANKVYLIHRRGEFRAEPYWVDEVRRKKNVEFVLERTVAEIVGEQTVCAVRLDKEWNGAQEIPVAGVFIEVGSVPATDLAKDMGCVLDERAFLRVDAGMRTSLEGVFGAGDVTNGSNHFAQFTTAAGEGAIAANSAFAYLQSRSVEGSMSGG